MIEKADVGQLRVASHKFNRNMQMQSTVQYCVKERYRQTDSGHMQEQAHGVFEAIAQSDHGEAGRFRNAFSRRSELVLSAGKGPFTQDGLRKTLKPREL